MPEIYTELTPPTAVTHSLTLPFTSLAASNLLVAKTNILQVFTTVTVQTSLSTPTPSDPDAAIGRRLSGDEEQGAFAGELTLQRSTVEDVCKLRLVAEFTISGEITGMVRVAAPQSTAREYRVGGGGGGGAGGDMVLVAFRDAKMSLLSWDGERQGLRTVSLHFYEREEFWSPVVSGGLPALLVADPGMRAVVLKFAGDMLAVLPVRQEGEEGEEGEEGMLDGDVEMVGKGDGRGGGKGAEEDDWDPNAMEGVVEEKKKVVVNGEEKKRRSTEGKADLPFLPSFVVSASQLDDAISHVLSLTFLHEYREPTLGILYSPKWTWTGWLEERKDTVCYIVITLDLEQKASTPIISVQSLPYDLFKVVPLSPPIGGSLLLGANEIIHIDQAGKTTGVAVNSYTKKATNFGGLADQSDLCLALEGSMVVELEGEGGDLLLLTRDGIAAIVGFRMDGRNVSGVSITTIAKHPGPLVGGLTTTAVSLGERRLFIGCDEGDARLLKWKRKGEKKQATEGPLEDQDVDDIYNMLDDVDDDLYGGDGTPPDVNGARRDSVFADSDTKVGDHRTKGEYMFQTHDRIVNLGPFRSVAMGRPAYPADAVEKQRGVVPELEIIATSGPTNTPEDAGLALIRRSIAPTIVGRFNFEACKALWTVRAKSMKPSETAQATGKEEQSRNVDNEYDRYFFVSKDGESSVFRVGDAFEEVRDTDFDADGATLDVGVLGEGARIVQVVAEQVRVYDCGAWYPSCCYRNIYYSTAFVPCVRSVLIVGDVEMNLSQIIPMMDETGDDGPAIAKAKVCDPYVILMRVDGSIVVYKLHKSMELEEERREGIKVCYSRWYVSSGIDMVQGSKYKSGSLYKARKGEVVANSSTDVDFILALLTEGGALQVSPQWALMQLFSDG
jgi:cleavage and polyadenylation specificity factor subunit 1